MRFQFAEHHLAVLHGAAGWDGARNHADDDGGNADGVVLEQRKHFSPVARRFVEAGRFGRRCQPRRRQRTIDLVVHVLERGDAVAFHMGAGAHGQKAADLAVDILVVFRELYHQPPEAGAEGQIAFQRQTQALAVLGRQRLGRIRRHLRCAEGGDPAQHQSRGEARHCFSDAPINHDTMVGENGATVSQKRKPKKTPFRMERGLFGGKMVSRGY